MNRKLSLLAGLLTVLLLAGFVVVEKPLERLKRLLTAYTTAYPEEKGLCTDR